MKKTGIILAILLLLVTLNSTYYFLGVLRVKFIEWFVFNACAPSSITYLIGFVLYLRFRDRIVMHMAILPMFFFGGLGLFVFPWDGINIIPQISHIIMVLTIGWLLIGTFRMKNFKSAAIGMLMGIVIFSVFIGFQQNYMATHHEDFKRILKIELPG
ncbi:MAG: hypothetical protein JSU92_03520 [Deltaproteobacteria bacterium]|nr:MAG: hypothetical protein JSU92_03520 [Deltaproteobacteria bacterium]